MPKFLLRIVTFFLLPCFLIEPTTASAFSLSLPGLKNAQGFSGHFLFDQEALSVPGIFGRLAKGAMAFFTRRRLGHGKEEASKEPQSLADENLVFLDEIHDGLQRRGFPVKWIEPNVLIIVTPAGLQVIFKLVSSNREIEVTGFGKSGEKTFDIRLGPMGAAFNGVSIPWILAVGIPPWGGRIHLIVPEKVYQDFQAPRLRIEELTQSGSQFAFDMDSRDDPHLLKRFTAMIVHSRAESILFPPQMLSALVSGDPQRRDVRPSRSS